MVWFEVLALWFESFPNYTRTPAQPRSARLRARMGKGEGGRVRVHGHGATHAHQLGVVLLEDAAGVRVGVGHGDHRVGLCAFTVLRVSKGLRPG